MDAPGEDSLLLLGVGLAEVDLICLFAKRGDGLVMSRVAVAPLLPVARVSGLAGDELDRRCREVSVALADAARRAPGGRIPLRAAAVPAVMSRAKSSAVAGFADDIPTDDAGVVIPDIDTLDPSACNHASELAELRV